MILIVNTYFETKALTEPKAQNFFLASVVHDFIHK